MQLLFYINGCHEDTIEFSKEVYHSDKINYSQTYKSNDLKLFKERQKVFMTLK